MNNNKSNRISKCKMLEQSKKSSNSRSIENESSVYLEFFKENANQNLLDTGLRILKEEQVLDKRELPDLNISSDRFVMDFKQNFKDLPIPEDTNFIRDTNNETTTNSKWFQWSPPVCGWTCYTGNGGQAWLGGDFWTAAVHCAVLGSWYGGSHLAVTCHSN